MLADDLWGDMEWRNDSQAMLSRMTGPSGKKVLILTSNLQKAVIHILVSTLLFLLCSRRSTINAPGIAELTGEQKQNLLEFMEDQHELHSTFITR